MRFAPSLPACSRCSSLWCRRCSFIPGFITTRDGVCWRRCYSILAETSGGSSSASPHKPKRFGWSSRSSPSPSSPGGGAPRLYTENRGLCPGTDPGARHLTLSISTALCALHSEVTALNAVSVIPSFVRASSERSDECHPERSEEPALSVGRRL
jgi:hypothetical protein